MAAKKRRVGIGIDFGTTKSHIAAIDLENREFKNLAHGTPQPIETLIHVQQIRDTVDLRTKWEYTFGSRAAYAKSGEGFVPDLKARLLRSTKHDSNLPPVEVLAAAMLRKLYGRVAQYQEKPENITVTIPADIGIDSRAAIMYSTRLAGLGSTNINLLEEPLAAFVAFYDEFVKDQDRTELQNKKVLVIDYGGGTCDVASIAISEGDQPPSVSQKENDDEIGGRAITNRLLEFILNKDPNETYRIFGGALEVEKYDIFSKVEQWKEAITNAFWRGGFSLPEFLTWHDRDRKQAMSERIGLQSVPLRPLEAISKPQIKTAHTFDLEAEQFDFIVRDKIQERFRRLLDKFASEAQEYAFVLLVGGSVQLPQVVIEVYEWLKRHKVRHPENKIWFSMDSASYIAKGAALYQYYLTRGEVPVRPLLDRTLSICTRPDIWRATHSIEELNRVGGIDPLIRKNAALPFPGSNNEIDVPPKCKLWNATDRLGNPIRVLRRTYDLKSMNPGQIPSQFVLLLLEGEKLLNQRMVHLPEAASPTVHLDLWVDEWGLLQITASYGEGNEGSNPFITHPYEPDSSIENIILEYALDFSLKS